MERNISNFRLIHAIKLFSHLQCALTQRQQYTFHTIQSKLVLKIHRPLYLHMHISIERRICILLGELSKTMQTTPNRIDSLLDTLFSFSLDLAVVVMLTALIHFMAAIYIYFNCIYIDKLIRICRMGECGSKTQQQQSPPPIDNDHI